MHRLTGHAWLLAAATAGACLCLELVAPATSAHRSASAGLALKSQSASDAAAKPQPSSVANAIDAEPEQISTLRPPEPKPPKLISPPVEATRPAARQRRATTEIDVADNGTRTSPPRTGTPDTPPAKRSDTGLKPPAFVRSLMDGVSSVLAPLGLP